MFRRALFAACVLLASTTGCQDNAASVTPDPAVDTRVSPAVASKPSASAASRSELTPAELAEFLGTPTAAPQPATAAPPAEPTSLEAAPASTAALGGSKAKAGDKAAPAPTAAPAANPAAAPAGKPAAAPAGKPAAAPAAPGKLAAKSELKLVTPGAAPRQKLRLRVKTAQVETMKMVLTMDVNVKELKQKQKLPPMSMTMRLKVAETRANGDIRYNFTLTETDVIGSKEHDPRLIAGMKQAMQKIYGLNGHAVVSDRGMNREAKINLPPSVDAQTKQVMQGMEQAMQQIGAPLPVEEVGKGAKWTYTTRISQGGVNLKQVATYELLSLADGKLTLKASVKQSAPKQQIAAPNGVKVSLLKLQSRGKGKTTMALARLAPSKSTMKMKSKMTMGAGKGKQMTIITGMLIDISSR